MVWKNRPFIPGKMDNLSVENEPFIRGKMDHLSVEKWTIYLWKNGSFICGKIDHVSVEKLIIYMQTIYLCGPQKMICEPYEGEPIAIRSPHPQRLAQPKVGNIDRHQIALGLLLGHEDVRRLQVAVHHAVRVQVRKPSEQLVGQSGLV